MLAAADKSDEKSFAAELPARDQSSRSNNGSGPSRPRVEIKQFDVGLSPSEVVGTQDVLQRFGANGDGRVDLLESDKAALVRQKVFTFAGLAAAPVSVPVPLAPAELSEAAAPALARETGAAIAGLSTIDESGLPKKFSASLVQDPTAKKYFAEAAQAARSGSVDAPKKYYGQGAEVVAGPVANSNTSTPAPVKYSDRAPVREQAVSEEGTGEVKYYDRVPQAEAGQGGGDPPRARSFPTRRRKSRPLMPRFKAKRRPKRQWLRSLRLSWVLELIWKPGTRARLFFGLGIQYDPDVLYQGPANGIGPVIAPPIYPR